MRLFRVIYALIAILPASLLPRPVSAADTPATGVILGQLQSVEMVAVSPDSKYLAFVRTEGDLRLVRVFEFATRSYIFSSRVSAKKLRSIEWVDDEHLIVEASQAQRPTGLSSVKSEWTFGQAINVKTKHLVPFRFEVFGKDTLNVLVSPVTVRRVNGSLVTFAEGLFLAGDEYDVGMFRVDPETGGTRLVAESYGSSTSWIIGEDGAVDAILDYRDGSKHWALKVRKGKGMSTVASGDAELDPPYLVGLTDDPNVAVVRIKEDEAYTYKRVSLVDGATLGDYEPGKHMRALYTERLTPRIIGGLDSDTDHVRYFDPTVQVVWDAIVKSAAGTYVGLESVSDDYKRWVVLVSSLTEGYGYYLFDMEARHGTKLTDAYVGLTKIAERKLITYQARDGLAIPSVLTLPPGRDPKNLPLVVLPHGGPESRVTSAFDWLAEAIALEGYAVLEPNFRGSTVSAEHVKAGYGEWGRKMQTDLSDGVRHLVKDGIADPARVCIVGASYGGYAALAGPTLDPGVYRCAVSIAGISDLARMLHWEAFAASDESSRYWNRFLQVRGANDPALKAISPALQVSAVTAPILLIHGKDDTVVNYDQSEIMRDALVKAGKQVEFVTLKAEDHWLSTSSTRSQMLEATLAFLRAHNPPN